MRKIIPFVVYALIATETFGGIRQHKQPLPKYKDATVPTEERVEDLLSRMTLKEKIGQLMSARLAYVRQNRGEDKQRHQVAYRA